MANIIDFGRCCEEPDWNSLSPQQLREHLAVVWERIRQLDEREPENMESEEYEAWGDRHEELEDLADEILDRLEELEETTT